MSIQIDLGEDTAVIQPLPETCERSDGGCTASDRMSFDEGSLVYISKSILTGHDIGAPGDYPPYYGRDRRR